MNRDWSIERLDATFGARVTGLRLAELDASQFRALHADWLEHALLVFPDQHLDDEQQVAFARRFGDLEIELAPLSNVRGNGELRPDDGSDDVVKVLRGNMGWHADSTYMSVQAKGAVFSARVVPTRGGETEWADMRAAFEALPRERRVELRALSAAHSLAYSQARLGHVHSDHSEYSGYGLGSGEVPRRPLVKRHPETGRESLLIGRHAHDVDGMDRETSEQFLESLVEWACQPPRVVSHRWQAGDVVVWDNRCLLHRARPWPMDQPRVMLHSRIAGDPDTEGAIQAA